ncbi:MAG TPA: hypothetical protein P5294_00665 [Smithellaceae bacterium]|nr:hypothetical protein [Smithellaceae bacterium]HRS88374.1 hypothetical protein [Smithellaceae bacterium]HRV25019.1 hypothetical protein [Smithellaceae bacterium]
MEKVNYNPAVKAALLSGLLFPGAGQIFLKKYYRGAIFIIWSLAFVFLLISHVVFTGKDILNSSLLSDTSSAKYNFLLLTAEIIKSLDLNYVVLIFLMIFILWIISIIDAYFSGKKDSLIRHV